MLYAWPRFRPFCRTYAIFQLPPDRIHFCKPAVLLPAASASTPSPSSPTYRVLALANHRPNGKSSVAPTSLAEMVGKPGSGAMGALAALASLGRLPGFPT